MPVAAIPREIAAITPEWLTEVLAEGGALEGARVTGFSRETIGVGVGIMGELARLSLAYDRPAADAPATVIAKLPSNIAANREIGQMFRFYEREARFYQAIAPTAPVRVPRCYHAGMDVAAGDFVLLLEDLSHARLGDQLAACTVNEARQALTEIARFHAAWWQHPDLPSLDWIPASDDPIQLAAEGLYQQGWPSIADAYGPILPAGFLEIGERFGTAINHLQRKFANVPNTIVHTDFRLDNMFFGTGSDPAVTIIDWQLMIRGGGLFDVGYFLSQSLDPAARRAHEMELLRHYHNTLLAEGVRGFSFDDCHDLYTAAVMLAFVIPGAGGAADFANERGRALQRAMVERSAIAITDLGAQRWLPT